MMSFQNAQCPTIFFNPSLCAFLCLKFLKEQLLSNVNIPCPLLFARPLSKADVACVVAMTWFPAKFLKWALALGASISDGKLRRGDSCLLLKGQLPHVANMFFFNFAILRNRIGPRLIYIELKVEVSNVKIDGWLKTTATCCSFFYMIKVVNVCIFKAFGDAIIYPKLF